MKVFLFFLIIFQGVMMGAVLDSVEVKGVKVPFIFEESSYIPTVNMQIIFKNSGSIQDGKLPGLALASSKILNEGTRKDGSVEFAKKLENRAIHLSASAGIETFVIDLSSLKSEFNRSVGFLKELISDPNISEESLEKIRAELNGVILRKESDFDYIAQMNLISILYNGTPLQSPHLGTAKSISDIGVEEITHFLRSHLNIKNAIVMMGGDIDVESAKKLVASVLDKLSVGKESKDGFYEVVSKGKFSETYKDTKQAYIYFGSPMRVDSLLEDGHKAKVASFVLGSSGFGSRIMEEVRVKRGLAYSAYLRSNINKTHYYNSGYLQTKLENKDEAIKLVKEVVKNFVENGITQNELDSAKSFILGSEPLRNELLGQRLSATFSEFYKGLPLGYKDMELKKIENLTLEEINSYIKEHEEILSLTFSVVTAKKVDKK